MSFLLNIYTGEVTEGGVDGTEVSSQATFTAPVTVTLDGEQNESQTVTCAVRAVDGYQTAGVVTIEDVSDTDDRVKLSWQSNKNFADRITTTDVIGATNKLFYVKFSSADTELPTLDRSVALRVSYAVQKAWSFQSRNSTTSRCRRRTRMTARPLSTVRSAVFSPSPSTALATSSTAKSTCARTLPRPKPIQSRRTRPHSMNARRSYRWAKGSAPR